MGKICFTNNVSAYIIWILILYLVYFWTLLCSISVEDCKPFLVRSFRETAINPHLYSIIYILHLFIMTYSPAARDLCLTRWLSLADRCDCYHCGDLALTAVMAGKVCSGMSLCRCCKSSRAMNCRSCQAVKCRETPGSGRGVERIINDHYDSN